MSKITFHDAPQTVWAAWLREVPSDWRSTSGGFFRVLVHEILERGGVVFGAAFDESFRLSHRGAETTQDCEAFYGSKYLQSDTASSCGDAKAALDADRWVLYSGTPCQIAGLYSFLGGDREHLITCDLVCGGTPSADVFYAFLDHIRKGRTVTDVRFRDGSWKKPFFTAVFSDGERYSQPLYETPFGRGFGMGLTLRSACGKCAYARSERVADFTLGDFWGYSGQLPERIGVSLVLRNSRRAAELNLPPLFEHIEKPLSEAVAGNPRLAFPVKLHPNRDAFFKDFTVQPFGQVAEKWLKKPSLPYRLFARLTPKFIKRLLGR